MRKRNIDPGFFACPELGEMEPFTRLLFIGTWCLADRNGNLEEKPMKMKAVLFPFDQVDVSTMLQSLVEAGMLRRYEAEGKRLLNIPNFLKFQCLSTWERRDGKTLPEEEKQEEKQATSDVRQTSSLKNVCSTSVVRQTSRRLLERPVNELNATLNTLTQDTGHRTQDDTTTPEAGPSAGDSEKIGGGKWAGFVTAFRECHEACSKVPEHHVIGAIRKYEASGLDVMEAIEAFGRQWAGAWPIPPMREFEKYLAKAARTAEEKANGGALPGPGTTIEPTRGAWEGPDWRKAAEERAKGNGGEA